MGELARATRGMAVTPAQSSAITFTDDHGDEITVTSEDVRVHICPKADEKEVVYFMELCRAQRLNPFLNEAYLVKFGSNPAQIITAHKVLVKRAEASSRYEGMEHGVVVMREGQVCHEQRGTAYPEAGETLIGGWAKVYIKGRRVPVYAERSLREMDKHQANWKTMPGVMIDKCAQAAALREAFPDDLRNMYSEAEMGQEAGVVVEAAPPEAPTGVVAEAVQGRPSDEDAAWLRDATAECVAAGTDEREARRRLWEAYKSGGREGAEAVRVTLTTGTPAQAVDVQPANVDPETGEILSHADVPELYDEDQEF